MKVNDYLTCRRTSYEMSEIWNSIDNDKFTSRIKNMFRKPIFQKNKKYRIRDINERTYSTNQTTSPYIVSPGIYPSFTTVKEYSIEGCAPCDFNWSPGIIPGLFENNVIFTETSLVNNFYTIKEERCMKLKKLKKLKI